MFYPARLRSGYVSGKGWRTFIEVRTPARQAKRDILAFQIIRDGLTVGATQPGETLRAYFKCRQKLSSDHTFAA